MTIETSTPPTGTGLAALEDRVRQDLDILAFPFKPWLSVQNSTSDAPPVYDVVVVGAGQAGISIAVGLLRENVKNILVIDKAELKDAKTKDLSAKLTKLGLSNALIIGGAELDANFAKAAQNIPNVDVLPAAGLNVYDVLRRKTLVLTKDALESIDARFNGAKAEA